MGLLVLMVGAMALPFLYRESWSQLQRYGYAAAFIFGLLAGSSLPLPLPYLVVTFTLGAANPWQVGLASGIGAGVGGTLVYLFGRGGTTLFKGIFASDKKETRMHPAMVKVMAWAATKGSLVVFIMSAMLNPVFAPMAIAMAALRFSTAKFFLWCTLGNVVKAMVIAYLGYFGLGKLLEALGIPL